MSRNPVETQRGQRAPDHVMPWLRRCHSLNHSPSTKVVQEGNAEPPIQRGNHMRIIVESLSCWRSGTHLKKILPTSAWWIQIKPSSCGSGLSLQFFQVFDSLCEIPLFSAHLIMARSDNLEALNTLLLTTNKSNKRTYINFKTFYWTSHHGILAAIQLHLTSPRCSTYWGFFSKKLSSQSKVPSSGTATGKITSYFPSCCAQLRS